MRTKTALQMHNPCQKETYADLLLKRIEANGREPAGKYNNVTIPAKMSFGEREELQRDKNKKIRKCF